jgi:hypothetical protein
LDGTLLSNMWLSSLRLPNNHWILLLWTSTLKPSNSTLQLTQVLLQPSTANRLVQILAFSLVRHSRQRLTLQQPKSKLVSLSNLEQFKPVLRLLCFDDLDNNLIYYHSKSTFTLI